MLRVSDVTAEGWSRGEVDEALCMEPGHDQENSAGAGLRQGQGSGQDSSHISNPLRTVETRQKQNKGDKSIL